MSVSNASTVNDARLSSSRSALLGFVGGGIVGVSGAGMEYLLRQRNLREVSLPTSLILYPLLGLGLGWLTSKFPHAQTWMRRKDFFSVEPLPQEEAESRARLVRTFVWRGFACGIAVALTGALLDFSWRGWPFLGFSLIGGLVFYPYMGMLLGYSLGLQPGHPKQSIKNLRFRMRTLMFMVAYVAILCGLGVQVGRYSSLAAIYHAKALSAGSTAETFRELAEKNQDTMMRADNAKQLREGRIPEGITPAQKTFLKSLDGTASDQYKQYRYKLIADSEDQQAKLASQNAIEFTRLVDHHTQLAKKYREAERHPWAPVAPDPPTP